jgi:tripartite ATP-independent transporter DctP family solute receptor
MKKILCVMLAAAMMACTLAGCGGEQSTEQAGETPPPVELHLAGSIASTHPMWDVLHGFADAVAEQSDGTIEIVLDLNGVMGSDREMTEALMNGSLAFAMISDMGMTGAIPEIGYLNLPYLFKDVQEQEDIYFYGWMGEMLAETLDSYGIKLCGSVFECDFRGLTNSKHAVVNPEDMVGLKLRVPENQMYVKFFEALGCQPTAMAITEVASALQQQVIDGQDNGPCVTTSYNFQDFNKYITKTNHAQTGMALVGSKTVFESLTADQQELLDNLFDEYTLKGQEATLAYIEDAYAMMEDAGCEISEPSEALQAKFKEVAMEIWNDTSITDKFTPAAMERILSELT